MRSPLATAALVACLATSSGVPARALQKPDYLIVPAERQWEKSGMLPHWTPSDLQARAAVSFLLDDAAKERGAGLQSLKNYRLQVLGVTSNAGNNLPGLQTEAAPLVVLQGVCSRAPPDLQKRMHEVEIVIMDGGNCYFRAYVDLEERRMAWLSINGRG